MTDRLRRLDALFAERVLGHTIQPDHRGMTAYDGGPPVVVGESATGDYGCSYGSIPHYTRSLDAAWTATNDGWCCRQVNGDFNFIYAAEVVRHKGHGEHEKFTAQAEGHPSEALVLACLRAVGCTEEEMK